MLIGQEYNVHLLRRMFEEGSFPHSLLMSGPRGTGKKTLAREVARALLCEKGVVFEPCPCQACHKVARDLHPDLRWYGLGEDLFSIKIEEIRDLIHWAGLKPYEGKAKVFVFDQAEIMTEEAANALLKTLEEPPPHSHILLLVESKHNLLETVVSRCFEVRVRSLGTRQLETLLTEGSKISRPEAHFLARHSKGSLGEAQVLKEAGALRERWEIFDAIFEGRIQELFEQWVGKKRKELVFRLNLVLSFFHDARVWKETEDQDFLESTEFGARLAPVTDVLSESNLRGLMAATELARKAIETNVNPKIALFHLGLKLERWLKKPST